MTSNRPRHQIPIQRNTARILKALYDGNIDELTILVNNGLFNANMLIPHKEFVVTTPLKIACNDKNFELAEMLLGEGANINWKSPLNNQTLLHLAVCIQDEELVLFLLMHGANMTLIDMYNRTPLYYAAIGYLTRWPRRHDPTTKMDREKSDRIIKYILQHGVRLQKNSPKEVLFVTIYEICLAIFENDVTYILNMLYKTTLKNAFSNNLEINPCLFAAWLNRYDITQIFLDRGVNFRELFLPMVCGGDPTIISMLLDKGCDVNIKNEFNENALHLACQLNNFELVNILLQRYDCKIDEVNSDGMTPIHLLFGDGFEHVFLDYIEDALKALLTYKIFDVNIPDNDGRRLLHYASINCEAYIILLEHGADPTISDYKGKFPAHTCWMFSTDCKVLAHLKKVAKLDHDFTKSQMKAIFPGLAYSKKGMLYGSKKNETELQHLQSVIISEKVGSLKKKTLLDYMFFEPNLAARYSKNRHIMQLYEKCKSNFQNEYANYGFILNYQYRKGLKRQQLIESVVEILEFSIGTGIPRDIIYEILQYSSEKMLQKLGTSV